MLHLHTTHIIIVCACFNKSASLLILLTHLNYKIITSTICHDQEKQVSFGLICWYKSKGSSMHRTNHVSHHSFITLL